LSVPIQKPFVLWSNSYWGGGKYGIGAESVTGQEAGATRVCCWALAVKASNEINTAIRKTVIARSSFKSMKMARPNLCEVVSLVLDNQRRNNRP
jgi:hypothetical protein